MTKNWSFVDRKEVLDDLQESGIGYLLDNFKADQMPDEGTILAFGLLLQAQELFEKLLHTQVEEEEHG